MMPRHSPERRSHGTLSSPAATGKAAPAATAACAPLPEELIFDVLSRVAVKSACRFRCASRGWHALISDQAFLAAHRSRHAEPLLVAITSSPEHAGGGRDLRLMDMDGNVVTVTNKDAGGLTLLSASMDELIGVTEVSSSRVIDPATGEVLARSSPKQVFGFYIMFGFGCAIPSGAYKMVRLVNNQTFEVFTLGDNAGWRRSKLPPIRVNGSSQVTANGVMYFMVSRQLDDDGLLCFDLESEEWKPTIKGPPITSSPEVWWNDTQSVHIAELNGFLCVIQSEMQTTSYNFTNVWLHADDSWIKAYSISAAPSSYYYMPLRVTHDGGKLIFYCFFHGQGHLLRSYDPVTNTCTTLRRLDDSTEKVGLCSLHLDRFVLNKI